LGLIVAISSRAPAYTTISASDFSSLVWNLNGSANFGAASYVNRENFSFVVREPGEPTTGYNHTFYRVIGTPAEIAGVDAAAIRIYDDSTDIANWTTDTPYAFIVFVKQPSFDQMSTFWVTLIVVIVGLVFFLGSLLIWGTDEYAKDPVNSLLFVTDGNRLVTGE
jgi:hypothetical protein